MRRYSVAREMPSACAAESGRQRCAVSAATMRLRSSSGSAPAGAAPSRAAMSAGRSPRVTRALDALSSAWPDVFNHNIETVPSLHRAARLSADYRGSLELLVQAKAARPTLMTKSGLMLGLGEREVRDTLRDLRAHEVDVLMFGQYLAPSAHHLPVRRYVSPDAFAAWRDAALALGFREVVAGTLVRSSYHAADVLADAQPAVCQACRVDTCARLTWRR